MLVSFRTSLVAFATCIPLLLGYVAIGSFSGSSACQNATLMSYSASTRECSPLVFLIDAALEMMILMRLRGAVPANVSNRTPWATSIESAAHEWSICSLFHLIKPLTSDFLTPSRSEHVQTADVWSLHRAQFVYQPSPSAETTVHLSYGHRLVCRLSRVWQRNSQESRRQGSKRTHKKTGHSTLSFALWPLLFDCFVTSRDKWSDRCGCGT